MTHTNAAAIVSHLPGQPRKNDDIFTRGSQSSLPFVYSYVQPDVEVVYGPACKPDKEINGSVCASDNVRITPRRGGGGTVVLSPGMVITVVVGRRSKDTSPIDIFGHIHAGIIALLAGLNPVVVEQAGISDLAIQGKKILGSSLYLQQTPPLYYYQSSLMVASDISLINRYLAYPPKEPEYRQGRSHNAFCTTLLREGCDVPAAEVAEMFSQQLTQLL